MKKTVVIAIVLGLIGLGIYAVYSYFATKSPNTIFTKAWAGMNSVNSDSDFVEYFGRIRRQHRQGTLKVFKDKKFVPASSFSDYFTNESIFQYYESSVKDLKKLNPDEDGKPLVAAAIDLYGLMDEIYRKEFPPIVEMMDKGVPDEELDAYLEEFTMAKGEEIAEKYDKLFELLTTYAKNHGIRYTEY